MFEWNIVSASAPHKTSGDVRYAHAVWSIFVARQAFLLHLSPDMYNAQSAITSDIPLSSKAFPDITVYRCTGMITAHLEIEDRFEFRYWNCR